MAEPSKIVKFKKPSGRRPPPAICPVCGEDVPPKAYACPECGADYESGWRDEQNHLLPADDGPFDYDEYVSREFGRPSPKPAGISWLWWVTALGLVLLFAYGTFRMVFSSF